MSIIKVEHLTKTYGDFHAVDHISFEVARGTMLGFLGVNGAGKSTLMNILGCLDRTVLGHYYLDGIDISTLNEDQL